MCTKFEVTLTTQNKKTRSLCGGEYVETLLNKFVLPSITQPVFCFVSPCLLFWCAENQERGKLDNMPEFTFQKESNIYPAEMTG